MSWESSSRRFCKTNYRANVPDVGTFAKALAGWCSCKSAKQTVGNDTGMPEYSPTVLDHFQNPRNLGDLPGADAVAEVENPACGDRTRLAIQVTDGRIAAARFRTEG